MPVSTRCIDPWDPRTAASDNEDTANDRRAALIASHSAQIRELAEQWAKVQPKTSADGHEARLRGELLEALLGAQERWQVKRPKLLRDHAPQVMAALIESKRNQMLASASLPGVKPLNLPALPAKLDRVGADPFVEESSAKAPVAAEVVKFLKALKLKYPGFRASTYGNHGLGSFKNKGYSVDLNLTSGRTKEGFYIPDDAVRFLLALDAIAKERKFNWRVLYNDFRVISAVNRALGLRRVVYVGTVFRDQKTRKPSSLNWHGPDPLILHMHLDLVPENRGLSDAIFGAVEDVGSGIATGLAAGRDALLLRSLVSGGERDPNKLTTELFYARHPERNRRPLGKSEKQGVAEWIEIRDKWVRPFLASQAPSKEWESNEPELDEGLPDVIGNVARLGREISLLSSLVSKGKTDPVQLTTEIFYARHPERNRQPLEKSEKQGIAEWRSIRDLQVIPFLVRFKPASQKAPSGQTPALASVPSTIKFSTASWDGWHGLSSVGGTRLAKSLATDPYTIAIAATSIVEGSFDKVQTYDRGILSWGIKQWTLHQGSLQKALAFMRQELSAAGKTALWQQLFPGVEIRDGNVLYVDGQRYQTQTELMQLIRNSTSQVSFERPHMERWMRIFVRAGRDPNIQALQLRLAAQELSRVLARTPLVPAAKLPFPQLADAKSIGHYLQGNTRALTFFQSMYTQNPSWAMAYVGKAVTGLRKRFGAESMWPTNWGTQFLSDYENLFKTSGVACWGTSALSKLACVKRSTRYTRTLEGLSLYGP
jgi:hypothetical protein